jgi:RNA polymerase sigma factor (sigma-70 family)
MDAPATEGLLPFAIPMPHEPSQPPSREVVDRLVGNHRAFLAFVERRVGDRALAEDILQDAFVRGLARLHQVRDEESVIAWFYRTLRNAVIDHHRRGQSAGRGLDAFTRELVASESPGPELLDEACRCVLELAADLDPSYADAIRRIDVEGQAVKDYAAAVGITATNAGVRVFRARQALRKQVARSCGTCAEHGCVDCTCGGPKPSSCDHR